MCIATPGVYCHALGLEEELNKAISQKNGSTVGCVILLSFVLGIKERERNREHLPSSLPPSLPFFLPLSLLF